ncbi:enoyl-CoA hydratase-related protein [Lacibacterium aquatile]|uniref:Enoyl-CoA hydratase-related protein n=1 Tax=Lacibacterium aquatile TaxID=1168082 RepID=A0ABW5DNT7_9PROT
MALVLVEHPTPAILTLRLNRPERRNALNTALLGELAVALKIAAADETCRAVILTGGDGLFAAGADLDEIIDLTPQSALTDPRLASWAAIRSFPKPLLAAVEGFCLGGGLELALACDLIIVGAGAQLGLPEVKLGLMPGAGGTALLPRMVGKSLAMRLALTGLPIDADQAVAGGLAAEAVDAGGALTRCLELAEAIAANGPVAVSQVKRSILNAFQMPAAEALVQERALYAGLQGGAEKAEGIAAFKGKRRPAF